jgi:CubicO group peptidase (beta-lactamase class C family)
VIPVLHGERKEKEMNANSAHLLVVVLSFTIAHVVDVGAGGTLGPTWQLGRFYEMVLLGKGTLNGRQILQPQTVADMTSLQAGQGLWHWGLGFNLIYAWGRYGSEASTKTFGHNGASGMIAFADPQVGIVIAMIGLRMTVIDRIYRDLGL